MSISSNRNVKKKNCCTELKLISNTVIQLLCSLSGTRDTVLRGDTPCYLGFSIVDLSGPNFSLMASQVSWYAISNQMLPTTFVWPSQARQIWGMCHPDWHSGPSPKIHSSGAMPRLYPIFTVLSAGIHSETWLILLTQSWRCGVLDWPTPVVLSM